MTETPIGKFTTAFAFAVTGAGMVVPFVTSVPDLTALIFLVAFVAIFLMWRSQ